MPSFRALLAVLALATGPLAAAQDFASGGASETPAPRRVASDALRDAPAYYVVRPGAEVRRAPVAGSPVVETLRLRDGVRVLDDGADSPWRRVQTASGEGYVAADALSNVWIRVDKSDRTVYVYRGAELLRELPADVSVGQGDKIRRARLDEQDLWRTPEGTFFVTRRNPSSSYYRAFVISYPGPVHALRGLEAGFITEAQYEAIVRAHQEGREPPQGTALGGLIEIHGSGSGRRTAWTRGCIALRNVHMDELWEIVQVGTPVVIEE